MPELPEAETLVRGLRPVVSGRTIERAVVHHADVLRVPAPAFRSAMSGRRVESVGRRAKNVVFRLDRGDVLVVNLGMTGWLAPVGVEGADPPRPTHPAVTFRFEGGGRLVFDDVRRFGCVEVLEPAAWAERDRRFGPEPLTGAFTPTRLAADLARSRSPVRSWLLDQRRVAGVGNIYANEALFRAGVHPRRPAADLSAAEAEALHAAVRDVLREAVESRGTTLRDYRDVDGRPGEFVNRLQVYGREGEPCVRCKTPVERLVFGNRSAFLCPRCQPLP